MTDPFILGVNYWPRKKAMYWWSDFDAGEVREEVVLRDFAATSPKVKPAERSISLPYTPADFYNNNWDYLLDLYARWKGEG